MSAMPIVATIYLGGEVTVSGSNSLKSGQEVQIAGDKNIPDGTYVVQHANPTQFQFDGSLMGHMWAQTGSTGVFAPVGVAVPTATATVVAAAPVAAGDWFTDPTQEIISGIPNIAIVGGAALVLLLLMKKK